MKKKDFVRKRFSAKIWIVFVIKIPSLNLKFLPLILEFHFNVDFSKFKIEILMEFLNQTFCSVFSTLILKFSILKKECQSLKLIFGF